MVGDILVASCWISLVVVSILYVLDYSLTIIGAKMYDSFVKNKVITFENSYELNPDLQGDISVFRRISPRFIVLLSLLLIVIWLARIYLSAKVYSFLIGGIILFQLVLHIRHIKNIVVFKCVKVSRGISGHIKYSMWFSYLSAFVDFISFGILFLVIFLISSDYFVLGGVITCLLQSLMFYLRAFKIRSNK